MSDAPNIWYPGVGADAAMSELHKLVGQITASWANLEDELFHVFLVALAGSLLVDNIKPYRAVFFSFSSYEGKMRMTDNAMTARYGNDKERMSEWKILKRAMNGFAKLRNEVAHLTPSAKPSIDPNAKANVRLIQPFWKSAFQDNEFDLLGYSIDELWQALSPYWGYHPKISLNPQGGEESYQLAYRVQQFAMQLAPISPTPNGQESC